MSKLYSLLTSSLHHLVELAFNMQLWVFGLYTFKLDGYLLTGGNVGTCRRTQKIKIKIKISQVTGQ